METRTNAEELLKFLDFADVDWKNLSADSFQEINFFSGSDHYTAEENDSDRADNLDEELHDLTMKDQDGLDSLGQVQIVEFSKSKDQVI